MKKACLLSLSLLAMSLGVHAVPAKRMVYTMKQSDGTTIQVYKHGESYCAYYTTLDGKVLYSNPDINYDLCYATVVDGKFVPTSIVAHDIAERTQVEIEYLSTCTINAASPEVLDLREGNEGPRRVHYSSTADGLGKYGTSALGAVKSIGNTKIPVILVNYADVKLQENSTIELYQRIMTEEGYSDLYGSVGSVRDYFVQNSYGMFNPDFQVVAAVNLSKDRSYYGANRGGSNGGDIRAEDMVIEAVELAAKQGVDFSKFTNAEGKVENVIVIYAGQGEASGGSPETIWPHEYDFEKTINGIQFNSYFVGNELNSQNRTDGIGTLVHEFSHALGLPDLYVTNYSYSGDNAFGMYSIMDSGPYAGNGYRPVGYTAYEKSYLGWLEIPTISDEQAVTLTDPNTSSTGFAVRINNPYSVSEYFIIENRQPGNWFLTNNPGGVMESHIAYNRNQWQFNTLNNEKKKKRCHCITADQSEINYSVNSSQLYGNNVNNIARFPLYSGVNLDDSEIYRVLLHEDGTATFNFRQRIIDGEYKPTTGQYYSLVRSVDELATGDSVIVVNGNNTLSVGTTFRDGLGKVAAVNVAQDGLVIANGDVQAFTVRKNTKSWALKVGNSYLAISRDGLTTTSSLTNGRFDLAINNGEASISFTANYANHLLSIDDQNYLTSVVSSNPSALRIYKLNTAAGIEGTTVAPEQQSAEKVVYNLQGQRVNSNGKLPKGIYIINGKKTVVR